MQNALSFPFDTMNGPLSTKSSTICTLRPINRTLSAIYIFIINMLRLLFAVASGRLNQDISPSLSRQGR